MMSDKNSNSPWMTVAESAEYMRMSISHVRGLIRRKLLTSSKRGRIYRVHQKHADCYLLFGTSSRKLTKSQQQLIRDLSNKPQKGMERR